MNTRNLTSKACEMLAEQMAVAEAEIVKNTAMVKEIKEALVDKKKAQIRRFIEGKTLRINGKLYTALFFSCIGGDADSSSMTVHIGFGLDPDYFGFNTRNLNVNEKRLVKEYKALYEDGKWGINDVTNKAYHVAVNLWDEKHHKKVFYSQIWDIDFGGMQKKGFFDNTSLTLPIIQEDGSEKETLLEDLFFCENF